MCSQRPRRRHRHGHTRAHKYIHAHTNSCTREHAEMNDKRVRGRWGGKDSNKSEIEQQNNFIQACAHTHTQTYAHKQNACVHTHTCPYIHTYVHIQKHKSTHELNNRRKEKRARERKVAYVHARNIKQEKENVSIVHGSRALKQKGTDISKDTRQKDCKHKGVCTHLQTHTKTSATVQIDSARESARDSKR